MAITAIDHFGDRQGKLMTPGNKVMITNSKYVVHIRQENIKDTKRRKNRGVEVENLYKRF